jgi:hypothetical protein
MKPRLDMEKIAEGLRAVRREKVSASAGYFGALQSLPGAGEGRPSSSAAMRLRNS